MSPITLDQWTKVGKALAYSFVSGFLASLVLTSVNFLQSGKPLDENLATSLVVAALVGGLNALAVTVKQLFTTPKV